MSMTSGFCSNSANAASMTVENSRSVIRTFASPCRNWKAMASASRRVFIVFSTAPHIGTPNAASYIGGVLGAMTATVSFLPMPRSDSAEASRRHRA